MPEQKNVLITGIRGFVGTNLKDYLKQQKQFLITGSSRNVSQIRHLEKEIHGVCSTGELLKNGNSFHAYVHLSGKVYNVRDKSNEKEYFDSNYLLTKKLFDRFCRDRKADKFVFLSTIHVLTENPEVVLDEDYVPKPFTPYGESKYLAEKYILKHCPPGKKVYVLRPSMIHGPGNKGNLNSLYRLIEKGLPYPLGAINNKRSFVSIENLCFIILQIIEQEVRPGLYHVADDEPTYTHDLVKFIGETVGKDVRIWNIPPALLVALAKIGNILPVPFNEHRLKKLMGDFIVSNKKIKREIGKPLPVSSMEGLKRTLSSLNGKNIKT